MCSKANLFNRCFIEGMVLKKSDVQRNACKLYTAIMGFSSLGIWDAMGVINSVGNIPKNRFF